MQIRSKNERYRAPLPPVTQQIGRWRFSWFPSPRSWVIEIRRYPGGVWVCDLGPVSIRYVTKRPTARDLRIWPRRISPPSGQTTGFTDARLLTGRPSPAHEAQQARAEVAALRSEMEARLSAGAELLARHVKELRALWKGLVTY